MAVSADFLFVYAAREGHLEVLEWARAGGAVLWVSHDEDLAARLGAREVRL